MHVNPSFIVDINFHLTCAVSDNKGLMLQLVLPPEYYTPEGRPIVPWEWLKLPHDVILRGAWEAWDRTRLHMSLDACKVSVWDDATMIAFCAVLAEKWRDAQQASVEFRVKKRFRRH